jgi:hypothetical protein
MIEFYLFVEISEFEFHVFDFVVVRGMGLFIRLICVRSLADEGLSLWESGMV